MTDGDLVRFFVSLTPRQRDVVQLVSQGLTNPQVAALLHIRESVVAGHLTNIYAALGNFEGYSSPFLPSRYILVRLFGTFFQNHPELWQPGWEDYTG